MQTHDESPGTDVADELSLDEFLGTLWAISVITRRMAGQISAMMQKKGESKHEQHVRTVRRYRRASPLR